MKREQIREIVKERGKVQRFLKGKKKERIDREEKLCEKGYGKSAQIVDPNVDRTEERREPRTSYREMIVHYFSFY